MVGGWGLLVMVRCGVAVAVAHEETRRCERSGGSRKAPMSTNDLPDEIVQPLMMFGRTLLRHVRAQRDHSLGDHEEGVLSAWRAAAPALLEAVLQLATTGLKANARPSPARCPRCQQRRGVQSQ